MPPRDESAALELVASNRKAFHDYFILDKVEAGLALKGSEVKSLRAKHCNLKDSYARIDPQGNAELLNFHISPFAQGNRWNPDPTRSRRLLLHQRELASLHASTQKKGLTLVPLRIYFRGSFAKVELGLAKGKQRWDRRADIKKRDLEREARAAFKMQRR